MNRISEAAAFVLIAAMVGATSGALATQSAVSELGLTETAARNFVLNDVKSPSSGPSGRIMTWGGVRPWTRPDGGNIYSPHPILL
jgi:hypothetical protein